MSKLIDNMTSEELQEVRESFCEVCKGEMYGWEDCHYACDGFEKACREYLEEIGP